MRTTGKSLSCVALLAWALCGSGLSQQPTPPGQAPTPAGQSPNPAGQTPPATEPHVIRVASNLVSVPVSVTNPKGEPVRNLKAEEFRIEENGQAQEVARVGEPGQTPLELALLFDVSGSLNPRFDFEREAAARFVRRILKPNDTIAIISIGSSPHLLIKQTPSLDSALRTLGEIVPSRQSTAFFDAVVTAAHALHEKGNPEARRVVVALTDGEDNNSENYGASEALRELQHADCIFYAVNPSGPSIRLNATSLRGQKELEKLAAQTAGTVFLPDRLEELDAIFNRITAELEAQYLLGYYPTNSAIDGSFRRINVRIPARTDLTLRARQGYYAGKHAPPAAKP
jgi:Ca-activated chloride channel family protein